MRRDPELSRACLIAVTGYGQSDDQRQAHEAGFDEHLTKPVAFADLQRLLSALQPSAEQ
jgi:CheY-like chemotaxis protein